MGSNASQAVPLVPDATETTDINSGTDSGMAGPRTDEVASYHPASSTSTCKETSDTEGGNAPYPSQPGIEQTAVRSRMAPLDEGAFPHFAPLLAASQDYASLSGCRFLSSSFADLPIAAEHGEISASGDAEEIPAVGVPAAVSDGTHAADGMQKEPVGGDAKSPNAAADCIRGACGDSEAGWLAAKLRARFAVCHFAQRLQEKEPGLVKDTERAFQVVMAESVRNAMIAAFRKLELWPPPPASSPASPRVCEADANCGDDDNYGDDLQQYDLAAPIPEIANRVWRDEERRLQMVDHNGSVNYPLRRAVTASYVVDFAHGVGFLLPPAPEKLLTLLARFHTRLEEYERSIGALVDEHGEPCSSSTGAGSAFLGSLGAGLGGAVWVTQEGLHLTWGITSHALYYGAYTVAMVGSFGLAHRLFQEEQPKIDSDECCSEGADPVRADPISACQQPQ